MRIKDDTIIDAVILSCRGILSSKQRSPQDIDIPVVADCDVNADIHVISPFRRDDLADDMIGAVDIRLRVHFPKIDAVLRSVHEKLDMSRPTPPFSLALSQLVPSGDVFGGNAFAFFSGNSLESQLEILRQEFAKNLLPLARKMSTVEIFDDDFFHLPKSSAARWWLYRAAKSVAYSTMLDAQVMVQRAMAEVTTPTTGNYSGVEAGVAALAAKGDERTNKYVTQMLVTMLELR